MQISDPALTRELQNGRPFVQTNVSFSQRMVLRGMHWQYPPQAKLIRVLEGEILDAIADVRKGSPTFGEHLTIELRSDQPISLYIPAGYAHGFCVISSHARVLYQCDIPYEPLGQRGFRWNDPDFDIRWGTDFPRLSEKDTELPLLSQIKRSEFPIFMG